MLSAEEAITRLCDPEARVSCHYLVSKSGEVVRMVPEERRAWHAGRSYWRGITDVNDDAVGIELDNPGHLNGYEPFPDAQIDALIPLVSDIMLRHRITRGNVVGHSDVAPARKRDPGELFPWSKLARLRLALPRPTQNLMDPHWTDAGFLLALERFGYDVSDKMAAVVAFQRRFRPELIDGEIDGECRSILLALLLPKPMGDD
jgi:N-acetylmuramoyl-L-alanine amidase